MTSKRQLGANRRNARLSTGPRSSAGKAVSAQNAMRHGLSTPVTADPAMSAEIEDLAVQIAGDADDGRLVHYARRVAEAECDLRRIRRLRLRLTTQIDNRHIAEGAPSARSSRVAVESVVIAPVAASETWKELAALERYERRAISQRKSAIRGFNIARLYSAPRIKRKVE